MAKVTFNKVTPVTEVKPVLAEFNGQEILIKQYLGIDDKSELVMRVLNNAVDDDNNFSPVRTDVWFTIEVIKTYTNISFTETQLKNIGTTYDKVIINGLYDFIKTNIPETELTEMRYYVDACIETIIKYQYSVLGTLKRIQTDYKDTDINVDELLKKIGDPEAFSMVKDIVTKLE